MGGVWVPGRGRLARALLAFTALYAFGYSVAKHAPVGVIVFTSLYLAVTALSSLRWWRAGRAAPPRRNDSAGAAQLSGSGPE